MLANSGTGGFSSHSAIAPSIVSSAISAIASRSSIGGSSWLGKCI